jgi:hypothetical protein
MGLRCVLASRFVALAAALAATVLAAVPASAGSPLRYYTDDDLTHGFFSTVFGIEHGARSGGMIVKKFHKPVRFAVVNDAEPGRERQVAKFLRSLPKMIPGLDARMAGPLERPNFVVHIVTRSSYVESVRSAAYGGSHGAAPGRCMVKVDFGSKGIDRANAFIVADEGEQLFKRCMIEETLQGLGPMNDDASLANSVFNDTSRHAKLMAFDRAIVAMLYDNRVKHGMSAGDVQAVLPAMLDTVRRRVR